MRTPSHCHSHASYDGTTGVASWRILFWWWASSKAEGQGRFEKQGFQRGAKGRGLVFEPDFQVNAETVWMYMGVSKNRGTPKWMVYNGRPMKTLLKWMVLGVPPFSETPIYIHKPHSIQISLRKNIMGGFGLKDTVSIWTNGGTGDFRLTWGPFFRTYWFAYCLLKYLPIYLHILLHNYR